MTPDAGPARQLPPVGHRARLADDPWRVGEGRARAAGAAARRRPVHVGLRPRAVAGALADRVVHASFLDRMPGARPPLPQAAAADEPRRSSRSTWPASTSSSPRATRARRTCSRRRGTLHVCYCHTPMRHAWEPRFLAGELGRRPRARGRALLLGGCAATTWPGARGPTSSSPTRTHVAARIRKLLPARRRSSYIRRSTSSATSHRAARADDYYLVLGRVVPYKRVDLARRRLRDARAAA